MARKLKVIEAGDLVKAVIYTAPGPNDGPKVRAEKSKMTSLAQKVMNDRTAKGRLEMLLAANFTGNDLFVTPTYRDEDLPQTRKEAQADIKRFIRALREVRKRLGIPLRYVYVTEDVHGEGRLHHHLIINATDRDLETLISLWGHGDVHIERLAKKEWDGWAEYMTKESGDRPVGARMWTPSRNLLKPTVTSRYVPDYARIDTPINVHIIERDERVTECGYYGYVKYRISPDQHQEQKDSEGGPPPYLACSKI